MSEIETSQIVIKYSDGSEQTIAKKSWLSKEDKIKIYELMSRLEPSLREENKLVWEEIQKVIFQEKQCAKPKTYFLTGKILEKRKERVRVKESIIGGKTYAVKSHGNVFYRIKIDAGDGGQPMLHYVWAFKDILDNPEEDWPRVEVIATGERYELEVEKPKSTNFKLRGLRKL
jgi:hypothetical protein